MDSSETPPESEFTQAEAYAPIEDAVSEVVSALPDFPGFEQRFWAELPCSHNGIDVPDYTNIEIEYRFSLKDSETELVREQYVDLLRDHWAARGHEITLDDQTELDDRTDRSLVAQRDDGIRLWYAVGRYAAVLVQSGCVPVSDEGEIEYIPPAGGIEPGGEGDKVGRYFPDGIPTDRADAVAPFEQPADYEDQL
ncbi:hypothetical protein L0U85_16855 [Glycomyces sp. L485]|uniref:hypothetical protein n=1 Tax=Glycomyces sp. L485 TaxID=2909235 RepID=UPI001F4B71F2|nr:hypothetical protein [Glycomyces sp. L485]MCH7232511.1 hypothetical protein [Glycomyces sp. L485]